MRLCSSRRKLVDKERLYSSLVGIVGNRLFQVVVKLDNVRLCDQVKMVHKCEALFKPCR